MRSPRLAGSPRPLLALALVLAATAAAAGCKSSAGQNTVICNPPCPLGIACTVDGCAIPPVDLGSLPGADLLTACVPPCAASTPYCNAQLQCVACITDDQCPSGQVCRTSGSVAVCVPGCQDDARCAGSGASMMCCGNACVDVSVDTANCGGCDVVCRAMHAAASCVEGVCTAGACSAGWGDCNRDAGDGCETNLHLDVGSCGACGTACSVANAIAGCADGCYIAACKFGWDDCNADVKDGCEKSILSDPANCGACGHSCPAVPHAKNKCLNASCALSSCDVGYADCDGMAANGCEVAVGSDVNNCGQCGAACGQGLVCRNGGCTCPQCNFPNASSKCANNVCIIDRCVQGFADCNNNPNDGCEKDITSDPTSCGACGIVCPQNAPACSSGVCSVGFDFGPVHSFTGLMSSHYITQGCCSTNNCMATMDQNAQYFCDHFYGTPLGLKCAPVPGYKVAQLQNCNDAKMHKNGGCTGNGNDIPKTVCENGPCKIGVWAECTTGITNLVCHCM